MFVYCDLCFIYCNTYESVLFSYIVSIEQILIGDTDGANEWLEKRKGIILPIIIFNFR
jgi:hypothetical protein